MTGFFEGFEKRAWREDLKKKMESLSLDEEGKENLKKLVVPGLAIAGAVGAGSYAVHRMGGKRLVAPVVYDKGKAPKTFFGKLMDRIRFGADEIIPFERGRNIFDAPKRVLGKKEVALVRRDPTKALLKGKSSRMKGTLDAVEGVADDKFVESQLIRKSTPKLHPETERLSNTPLGDAFDSQEKIDALTSIHKQWSGGGKRYLIKRTDSAMTGPGAANFINEKDVEMALSNKLKDKNKQKLMNEMFFGDPDNYMIQRKMDIIPDKVTGKGIEFRVHSIGNKVMDTTIRTGIVPNPAEASKATKAMQEFLNKMPEKLKKKQVMFAADVAKTKDGYKIIELNPGAGSGYLDPDYMKRKGVIPHLKSIALNNKYYQELARRKSQLSAAGASAATAGAALGVGGASAYLNELRKKKDRENER